MKYLHLTILSVLMLVVASCSKSSNDDAASLLKTVPADASSVAVVNIPHTVEALGGKIDGNKISPSKDMMKIIDGSASLTPERKALLKAICDGESGISPTALVYYSAARSYISGMLDDPDKFIAFIQKHSSPEGEAPLTVRQENGARIVGLNVVIGNQFWICTEGQPDVEQLKYTQQLNDRQSFAGSEAAAKLLDPDKVINFVVDYNRTMMKMPELSYVRMGMALAFEDIAYLSGSADFRKGTLVAQASVLNSEMTEADLQIPVKKLDAADIRQLKGAADIFFAIGLSPKLTKSIAESLKDIPIAKMIAPALSEIDGTVAVRLDSSLADAEAYIQTTGKNFSDMSYIAETMLGMSVKRDGDKVIMTKGNPDFTGTVTPEEAADKLKGAWLGFMSYSVLHRDLTTMIRLTPHKKSLMVEAEITGGVEPMLKILL
ncbi:MAG: DUF4836 family protein [Muribaculaceae bacterium]|nr:DUF4836 family protein [Muribaculaceae bacterium]